MISYTICLWLISLSVIHSKPIHCCKSCCKWQDFILFMAEQYSIVYIHYIFFIHSSVDGHLGCFHILAILNSSAVNTGVNVSFQISVFVFFGYIPRSGVELLDHMVILMFLLFWGTSILFPTVAAPIYIPTNSAQGFPFLHILTTICYLWSFWW